MRKLNPRLVSLLDVFMKSVENYTFESLFPASWFLAELATFLKQRKAKGTGSAERTKAAEVAIFLNPHPFLPLENSKALPSDSLALRTYLFE